MSAPALDPVAAGVRRPAVSLVMPTYQRADVIEATLRTALAQTFGDFELLVRSDGPDPETARRVRAIQDDRLQYSWNDTRQGMPRILNRLICASSGRYVLVLHDHDLFEPRLVERMVEALGRHPTALYVHTALRQIDSAGRTTQEYVGNYADLTPGAQWLSYMLSRFDCPVCAMSMVRRETYEQYGLYDPRFGFVSDVEMWIRLASHGDVAYIRDILMSCRAREGDHAYRTVNWDSVDAVIGIHSTYRRQSDGPAWRFELQAERFRFVQLLASLKSTRGAWPARQAAGRYLRRSGGLVTRSLARTLLPQ